MTTSDPIADMLARTRNALMAKHTMVSMPSSKMKIAIAKILNDEGFINDYRVVEDEDSPSQVLQLALKYVGDMKHQRAVITDLKRVSKPGRRIYTAVKEIPWVRSGMGIAVLSTPKGVLTGQQARRLNVGGEILCYVW
jgi:small subunit ribosomal protein S8